MYIVLVQKNTSQFRIQCSALTIGVCTDEARYTRTPAPMASSLSKKQCILHANCIRLIYYILCTLYNKFGFHLPKITIKISFSSVIFQH